MMRSAHTPQRRWSEIMGMAAIAIDSGKKVGTIEDFYFDTQTGKVQAFQIKIGMFSHRVLKSYKITSLGMDALTFSSERDLLKDVRAVPLAGDGRALLNYRVLSEGGNIVGEVGNVLLDTDDPTHIHIAAFELKGGFRAHLKRKFSTLPADHVLRYGEHVLVVSDSIAQSI